jgi:hypothetical protein
MMNIRDYPGFKWKPFPKADGDIYDTWEALFDNSCILSIEGRFYADVKNHEIGYVTHVSIHDAMDYIKNYAIIKYFDEDQNM